MKAIDLNSKKRELNTCPICRSERIGFTEEIPCCIIRPRSSNQPAILYFRQTAKSQIIRDILVYLRIFDSYITIDENGREIIRMRRLSLDKGQDIENVESIESSILYVNLDFQRKVRDIFWTTLWIAKVGNTGRFEQIIGRAIRNEPVVDGVKEEKPKPAEKNRKPTMKDLQKYNRIQMKSQMNNRR